MLATDATITRARAPFAQHVLQRTVVLREQRVLFLPNPKAGCTSLLWLLATLARIPPATFEDSTGPEPSPALTVHDMRRWPPACRFAELEPAERDEILAAEDWLRFSLVRDPAERLWSAWQSKLLLREPRFVELFGDAAWFPRVPRLPREVVEDFRAFVAAVGRGEAHDVHWSVQAALLERLPLTHVGRVERMGDTLERLREHVGEGAWPGEQPRENASPLRLPPGGFDREGLHTVREVYGADLERFGYDPPRPAAVDAGWEERTAALLPLVRALIEERERAARVHAVARRRGRLLAAAEERLARQGRPRPTVAPAEEGEPEFAVRWGWADGPLAPGFTAVVRVKDEARALPWALPPLLRAAERVVLVDNGSTDGTPELARALAAEAGAAERLEVVAYPFAIARCGSEHLATAAGSVHSLTHFYNWSFAHVRTGYALKWDGDMVLTDAAAATLRDLAWQLEGAERIVRVPRSPLYVASDRVAHLDTALVNREPWAWPNRPGYEFVKALEWELPMFPPAVAALTLPEHGCVELKHLDAEEFGHWSRTDFAASARTSRKRRESEVFAALAGGREPPPGVREIVAPPGRHVIAYVRDVVLPELARGS